MLKETVLSWVKSCGYYPRNYRLEIEPYRVFIITGVHPDEESVPKFDIPMIFKEEKIVVLYIKEPDLKRNFASTDSIMEGITSRGKGLFKINTARLMVDKAENELYNLRNSLLKPYYSLVGYIMRLGLGLDELDTQYIRTFAALHYLHTSYSGDKEALISKHNIGVNLPGFENHLSTVFNDMGDTLADTLHNNVSKYETSRRLKSLSVPEYNEIFSSLVPMDMRPYMEKALEDNSVFASLLLEVSTNLFYKKSKFGQFLMNNKKILDLDDVTKNIESTLNL